MSTTDFYNTNELPPNHYWIPLEDQTLESTPEFIGFVQYIRHEPINDFAISYDMQLKQIKGKCFNNNSMHPIEYYFIVYFGFNHEDVVGAVIYSKLRIALGSTCRPVYGIKYKHENNKNAMHFNLIEEKHRLNIIHASHELPQDQSEWYFRVVKKGSDISTYERILKDGKFLFDVSQALKNEKIAVVKNGNNPTSFKGIVKNNSYFYLVGTGKGIARPNEFTLIKSKDHPFYFRSK